MDPNIAGQPPSQRPAGVTLPEPPASPPASGAGATFSREDAEKAAREAALKAVEEERDRQAAAAKVKADEAAAAAAKAEADAKKSESQLAEDERIAKLDAATQRAEAAAAAADARAAKQTEGQLYERLRRMGLRVPREQFAAIAGGLSVDLDDAGAAVKLEEWRASNAWAFDAAPGPKKAPDVQATADAYGARIKQLNPRLSNERVEQMKKSQAARLARNLATEAKRGVL